MSEGRVGGTLGASHSPAVGAASAVAQTASLDVVTATQQGGTAAAGNPTATGIAAAPASHKRNLNLPEV